MRPELLIPLFFACFAALAWFIGTYNKFIKYRNRIEESLNNIDVSLKRRANLIPNLIKVVERYGEHEDTIYREKTRQSAILSDPERIAEEHEITKGISGLLAVAEAYPDLKASGNFLDLQKNLDSIEKEIQQIRNIHNSYIGRFNTMVESFPASLIAGKFSFQKLEYLNLELTAEQSSSDISFTP